MIVTKKERKALWYNENYTIFKTLGHIYKWNKIYCFLAKATIPNPMYALYTHVHI